MSNEILQWMTAAHQQAGISCMQLALGYIHAYADDVMQARAAGLSPGNLRSFLLSRGMPESVSLVTFTRALKKAESNPEALQRLSSMQSSASHPSGSAGMLNDQVTSQVTQLVGQLVPQLLSLLMQQGAPQASVGRMAADTGAAADRSAAQERQEPAAADQAPSGGVTFAQLRQAWRERQAAETDETEDGGSPAAGTDVKGETVARGAAVKTDTAEGSAVTASRTAQPASQAPAVITGKPPVKTVTDRYGNTYELEADGLTLKGLPFGLRPDLDQVQREFFWKQHPEGDPRHRQPPPLTEFVPGDGLFPFQESAYNTMLSGFKIEDFYPNFAYDQKTGMVYARRRDPALDGQELRPDAPEIHPFALEFNYYPVLTNPRSQFFYRLPATEHVPLERDKIHLEQVFFYHVGYEEQYGTVRKPEMFWHVLGWDVPERPDRYLKHDFSQGFPGFPPQPGEWRW